LIEFTASGCEFTRLIDGNWFMDSKFLQTHQEQFPYLLPFEKIMKSLLEQDSTRELESFIDLYTRRSPSEIEKEKGTIISGGKVRNQVIGLVKIGFERIKILSPKQPDPENKGEEVTPKLISWIQNNRSIENETRDQMIKLINSRHKYGVDKYGHGLMTGDKRRTIQDALEELGDLIQYLFKAKLNGENMDEIRDLAKVLDLLLKDMGSNQVQD
jgi:hypothetical protein